jgi:hypothetical protein
MRNLGYPPAPESIPMAMKSCNNHPTVSAIMHCSQCHKPICEKCIKNGRFCSEPCNEKFSKFYEVFNKGGRKPPSKVLRFVGSIAGLALLVGGIYLILKFLGVPIPGR